MTKCSRGAASSFARSLVHGDASVKALHAWTGGAFGELLVFDAESGAAISGPAPGTRGAQKKQKKEQKETESKEHNTM